MVSMGYSLYVYTMYTIKKRGGIPMVGTPPGGARHILLMVVLGHSTVMCPAILAIRGIVLVEGHYHGVVVSRLIVLGYACGRGLVHVCE
jgi:hypothetical protein